MSHHIRYIAIYLADGGMIPHEASAILKNRYGDCKDHNTLLIALFRAKGIEASSAIINSGNTFSYPKVSTVAPFNHMITYLPQWDLYVDSTGELYPFGNLPDSLLDKPTILVDLKKMGHTPKQEAIINTIETTTKLTIKSDGRIEGTSTTKYKGDSEIAARNTYYGYEDLKEDRMVKNHLSAFRNTGGGKFFPSDVSDLNKPFTLGSTFTLNPITNVPGPGVTTLPAGLTPGKLYAISYQ